MKIHVLIPTYNNAHWLERTLDSVVKQERWNECTAMIVDDASTDDSVEIIQSYFEDHLQIDYYVNKVNKKCPQNLYEGIQAIHADPDDVVLIVDGDDFLPETSVLKRFFEIYEDPDVWLTYGNYSPFPIDTGQAPATDYSPEVIRTRSYRATGCQYFNHPLTFRVHLWNRLVPADMQDPSGRWYRIGYDKIIMLPLLELATPYNGPRHWRFIDEDLYKYNAVNPESDVNKDWGTQVLEIWKRPVKEPHTR